MGGGTGGVSHTCYATFNRWNDERNVNVNRNDNDWNDNWSFAGVRNSLHFSPRSRGVEFRANCPCHPPNIFPISSSCTDRAAYFFVSSDLLSQSIRHNNLTVSSLRTAARI